MLVWLRNGTQIFADENNADFRRYMYIKNTFQH